MTRWQDLIVFSEGAEWGALARMVAEQPETLRQYAGVCGGSIAVFEYHMLAAPGEEPDWDTPRGDVDWQGFPEALAAA